MRTTPKLVVNGTNFNLKNTELYFDPPLMEFTDFTKQVRRDKGGVPVSAAGLLKRS